MFGLFTNEQAVLDTLGLAGNLETARLMELAARHDTAAALETLSRLYAGGKDVGAVLDRFPLRDYFGTITRDQVLDTIFYVD